MLLRLIVGVFVVLHGLVHLLYFGQSRRLFELQPNMTWPDGSWAVSRLLGKGITRWVAAVACVLAAIGFAVGGATILLGQAWWHPVVVGAAALSALIWLLFWDGTRQNLANQGAIAILINLTVLLLVLVFQWPDFGF